MKAEQQKLRKESSAAIRRTRQALGKSVKAQAAELKETIKKERLEDLYHQTPHEEGDIDDFIEAEEKKGGQQALQQLVRGERKLQLF